MNNLIAVQHLQFWDYTSVSGTKKDRYIEYVDQQHDQFVSGASVKNAHYIATQVPGFNTQFTDECIKNYNYPSGNKWQELFDANVFKRPN